MVIYIGGQTFVRSFVRSFGRTEAKLRTDEKKFGRKFFRRKNVRQFFFDEKRFWTKKVDAG